MSQAVYAIITERVCALLSAGVAPWRKPWRVEVGADGSRSVALPKNLHSGKPYRGVNLFMLHASGFRSPWWLTYKQAEARGAQVRKGEKGTPVIFWKVTDKPTIGDDGERINGKSFLLRYYTVFNAEQVDGLDVPAPAPIIAPSEPEPQAPAFQPIPACDAIAAGMPNAPTVTHGGDRACYWPARDAIDMPERGRFVSAPEYYSTLFHELSHATGHRSRLAREGITKGTYFGSADYSREELVAEMSAAFLCAIAGIETATLDNSAAYLQGWLSALKRDPRMIVTAGAQAQKAADFILNRKADEKPAQDSEAA